MVGLHYTREHALRGLDARVAVEAGSQQVAGPNGQNDSTRSGWRLAYFDVEPVWVADGTSRAMAFRLQVGI